MRRTLLPTPSCSQGSGYEHAPQKRFGYPICQQSHVRFGNTGALHELHHLAKLSLLAQASHLHFHRGSQIQTASQHIAAQSSGKRPRFAREQGFVHLRCSAHDAAIGCKRFTYSDLNHIHGFQVTQGGHGPRTRVGFAMHGVGQAVHDGF